MSAPALDTVRCAIEGPVAVVALDRPDRLNAFDAALRRDLRAAVDWANGADGVRAVVLTGEGRGFCAGADLAAKNPPDQTVQQRIEDEYAPALLGIATGPLPWIAAVEGAAAGIGSALALSCDLIVMAEGAYLYQAFSAIGLIPDGGATWHLPRLLGRYRAFEIMALGERLPADECHSAGIAQRLTFKGGARDEAMALAARLATRAPLSLALTKEALRRASGLDLGGAISMEAALQQRASASEDHAEGRAAFLEKRDPVWRGR